MLSQRIDPERTFAQAERVNDDGFCVDFTIADRSPKSLRRNWRIWFDREVARWFADKQRSATDDGCFDHDVKLPEAFVAILKSRINPADLDAIK